MFMKLQVLLEVFYIQEVCEGGFVVICVFTDEVADVQRGESS